MEDEGGTCSTQGSDENAYKNWSENYVVGIGVDGRVILKWKLTKCGIIVLDSYGSSGGLL
jgi:hypothetical protein